MAKFIKKTTGLTGLQVSNNPREQLISLYKKILGVLNEMPDSAAYKNYTRANINQRLTIVQNENDPQAIEQKINCGQCEELIVQAENELSLAYRFLRDKPWEPPIEPAPENQWKWPIN
ncbi:hypothetical protein SSS_10364 [Sarcoptes scabiei]|uniref:NADH dehydrogenase [ubiquinone] 1 alpha subcomplex subunit 5 n=1 Tax=Sarcoptes scabiei TaxID=52283 RepID=A0A132ADM4_SARSC|nr:hypothetical protein SSS_10364 [Sarcoptes scabiei]KPM08550.1 NADH dehydrogenase [ubiquinone] 1 alpha subcomplex subunit 5-like protein [Sarcoptes scabiei]UXI20405.1 Insulin-like growth factor-binding protein complex acid labile chain [Sarcoptes scabiei]